MKRTVGVRIMAPSAALLLAACAPPATEARFDSPNPAARLYAIEKAMRTNDTTAVPQIVEQLDSEDPVVRMLAIEALKQLRGGQTYDYDFTGPEAERQAAIRRWVDAVQSATASTAGAGNPGLYDDG